MPRPQKLLRGTILTLFVVIIFVIMTISSMTKNFYEPAFGGRVSDDIAMDFCRDALFNGEVETAKGTKMYGEVMTLVYEPYGYKYRKIASARPNCSTEKILFPLTSKKQSQCSRIFKEWISISEKWENSRHSKDAAPSKIPSDLRKKFSMNKLAKVTHHYLNEVPSMLKQKILEPWTKDMIEEHKALFRAEEFGSMPYRSETGAVFNAFKHFKPTGQSGMVIGSQSPWVEAMLLFYGARKITTVEYAPLSILHASIDYVHPNELAKSWHDYTNLDFVVSFSSIEHSGLGRYGDPLDPMGDLREVDKIRCLLKKGGLLYIGLPCGQDKVVFNAHRLYGYVRWPMIASGFEFLGAFHAKHKEIHRTPPVIKNNDYKQILFVLKKL